MVRTRVGYTGGTLANPTYRRMGDHTEAIQLDFDPARVTYAELLKIFWASVEPDYEPYKRQYMSAIWPHSRAQHELARASYAEQERVRGKKLYVELAEAGTFTVAEDYHQKYYLRHEPALMQAFTASGYDDASFRESRVAARLNGFAGHAAEWMALEHEIPRFGLTPMAEELLGRLRKRRT